MEQWKEIEDWNSYEVSNQGNVRRTKSKRPLKPNYHKCGYKVVTLCVAYVKQYFLIHRLVAQAFVPNPQNHPQVDHINRNKLDNSVSNLRWVTNYENCQNRVQKAPGVTGQKYISIKGDKYFVSIRIRGLKFYKLCGSLNDAIKVRDEELAKK